MQCFFNRRTKDKINKKNIAISDTQAVGRYVYWKNRYNRPFTPCPTFDIRRRLAYYNACVCRNAFAFRTAAPRGRRGSVTDSVLVVGTLSERTFYSSYRDAYLYTHTRICIYSYGAVCTHLWDGFRVLRAQMRLKFRFWQLNRVAPLQRRRAPL